MHALLQNAGNDTLFLTLIETAVDGIVVIDVAGNIQVFNPACVRLFGFQPDEVLGKNVAILMPPPYRGLHAHFVGQYVKTGDAKIIGIGREVMGQRKDGSTFPMYLSVGEGTLHGQRIFVGIIHDISARRELEQRLSAMQNELSHIGRVGVMGEMTASLAHELNQPLAAALNYVNAAKRMMGTPAEPAQVKPSAEGAARAADMVEKAAVQIARAGDIIKSLRDFVVKAEPVRRKEDINVIAGEALDFCLADLRVHLIHVEKRLAAKLPALMVDRVQIQQIVVNLLRNAIDALAGQETREITLLTRAGEIKGKPAVELLVADSGPGVAADVLARLFEPFTTSKPAGLGVGLAICRSIAQAHGGEIVYAPDDAAALGCRTAFLLRLPAVEASP
ncbi:MAG TPA: PAS domain S-box protein [Micropepsaceae bacterium]|nr:PAS domain S-box protein [Micropepsaceae bacterium]